MRQFVFWVFLLVIAAALGGSVAYAARPWVDAAKVISDVTGQTLPTASRPTFTPVPSPTGAAAASPLPTATPTTPPIVSPHGRVNYLLLGSDNDSKNKLPGADPNTQSIIFVSYDTQRNQVYMISISRDLYLPITGFGLDKIDTAPGYGNLATLIATVQDNFHVTVNHWAWVGLEGFIKILDALGGVDMVVSRPMVENDFPNDLNPTVDPHAYMRFFLPAGPQHLDGVSALEYVRARHADLIGDFGRSQRQQQVLLQLKQKLKTIDLGAAPTIIQDLKGEFRTDLTIPEILGLAHSLLGLKNSQIQRYSMTNANGYMTDKVLTVGTSTNDVEIPDWDKINALFQCVMSDKAYLGCSQ